jgi:hypothetical protein
MTNEKKVLEIIKRNDGFITSKEVVENGINNMALTRLINDGVLERISRGYYVMTGHIADDFYRIQSKSKNSVFSLATALYLHNLSDRTPLVLNMTVPYDYNGTLRSEKSVSLTFVSRDILDLGVIVIVSPFGTKLRVYDVEKTICDIIKNRNKMDAEIFSSALKNYARLKNKDLRKLVQYARVMKIENKVQEYMGLLL